MDLAGLGLRQRDGVTCGPTVAVVAGAMVDAGRRARLAEPGWFAAEQARVHGDINRLWPRRLGTTPCGMVRALNEWCAPFGVRYRWRLFRGRRDSLVDVVGSVADGWPVPMLVGRFIPRHWVLVVGVQNGRLRCYEPTSGAVRTVGLESVRRGRLVGLGFRRPFVFAVPYSNV
ncbi:hypothetical protein [Mycolicibacterium celeriflavum]|uniref:hypothetical protein n=1 Tax=Mycolicibacterium celeriflavum TaxID=1249101 RepID=UPI003CED8928